MKWFDRQFDFSIAADEADIIAHRLRHTPARIQQLVVHVPELALTDKPGGKWSVKEHIGHLTVLEPLWRIRFEEIERGESRMSPADLDNKATNEANFNQYSTSQLLDHFLKERSLTLSQIARINLHDQSKSSLHPRLQKPMRFADHAYFIAEHDDHHFTTICELVKIHHSHPA